MVRVDEEQWCLAVPKREAEQTRRRLLEEGLLDRRLKPRPEGDAVLLPVTEEVAGAVRCGFEPVPEQVVLPRHELVGGIAIMQDDDPEAARSW